MTSFAFILGCVPYDGFRRWIGCPSDYGYHGNWGMLAASVIGIFFIPVIFYVVEKVSGALRGRPLLQRQDLLRRRETDICGNRSSRPH